MLGIGTKHVVEDGSVYCSARDEAVSVQRCHSCIALRAISRETVQDGSEISIVRCEPPLQLATV